MKFDILPPNTLLTQEGQTKVPIAYLVMFGNLRFFKHDTKTDANGQEIFEEPTQECHGAHLRNFNVQESIKRK